MTDFYDSSDDSDNNSRSKWNKTSKIKFNGILWTPASDPSRSNAKRNDYVREHLPRAIKVLQDLNMEIGAYQAPTTGNSKLWKTNFFTYLKHTSNNAQRIALGKLIIRNKCYDLSESQIIGYVEEYEQNMTDEELAMTEPPNKKQRR